VRASRKADGLSRDSAEVDKYIADPLCRFQPALQLWIDLVGAFSEIAKPARQKRIPKPLPIYVIAGTRDPVSANSKGLEQLLSAYHAAGLQRVTCRFYPEARHELFNETNRDEVTRELLAWLDEATGHGEYSRRGRPQPAGRRFWA
jgi:alpha-beta hydrolase superfamily lysophospholipase